MKILVIRLRYLGDVVLLDPVHRALRKYYPDAEIYSLVPAGAVSVVENGTHQIMALGWDSRHQLRSFFNVIAKKYDVVIDITGSDRSAFLTCMTMAKVRVAYQARNESKHSLKRFCYTQRLIHEKTKPHIIEQHLKLLEKMLGVPSQGTDIEINLPDEAVCWAESILNQDNTDAPLLFVHITSRDMMKSMPVEHVSQSIRAIINRGVRVIYSVGPSDLEKEYAKVLEENLGPIDKSHYLSVAPPDWWKICALIKNADAFWGADSAPMHVASAFKKPLLVYFGPSDARHWRPLNDEAQVCVRDCKCLNNKVACEPNVSGKCLKDVSVEDSVERLLSILSPAFRGKI